MGYSSPASPESPAGPVSPEVPQTSPAGPLEETELAGVDKLLSTAVSSGLSDPYNPAQDGWVAASLAVDPYTGLAAGQDGVDPLTGGQAVDPYDNTPAETDKSNAYTGGQNVEPFSGVQNADAVTGGGNAATAPASLMLNFGVGADLVSAAGSPTSDANSVSQTSGSNIVDTNIVYDGNGVPYVQYTYSDGTVAIVAYDNRGPVAYRFPALDLTESALPARGASLPSDFVQDTAQQGPVTKPSASQTPTPTASVPPPADATATPASATSTAPPSPAQPPSTPPAATPSPPAPPSASASAPQTNPEQRDEENWSAAKAGMWDSMVNMVEGLANMGPQAAVNSLLPGVGGLFGSSVPHVSFDWAKSGPPAPTGDPTRDAELKDNYRSGGWVTTTVSLALPFAAEGMLGSALSAAGKLPALEGAGMIGGGRLIGPTEQWLASFGETSETLAPEAADVLAPGTQASTPAAQSENALANQNLQHVIRGGSSDRGIGVLHLDGSKLSPADVQAAVTAARDMDFQAGMAGGLTRSSVSSRSIADSVTRLARSSDAMNLGTDAAGHLPDVAGGGNPYGPIMGLPRSVNSSIGGQWSRYAPGFTFDGFSLVDRSTGAYLYMSQGLEEEPALILDFR
jgi:hypothetical protein